MKNIKWVYTNETTTWKEKQCVTGGTNRPTLSLNGNEYQRMNGFGACFNELGYDALMAVSESQREEILRELFETGDDRCNFTLCRMPIGANDYSLDWYSLNEQAGDYEMNHFSVARDGKYLIPFIQSALKCREGLKIFASPWSPPTWMKNPAVYNWGKLIKTEENLRAYALYFVKFVKAYEERGIHIHQVHVQNEPVADQKFPSCMWTGEELRDFIRDYLGPAFAEHQLDTEIWLGTINAPGCDYNNLIFDKWATEDYDYFANTVLIDDDARKYISGVSYQWGGKIAVQRTFESWWPEIRLMQSENECGFGDNTWEYAKYNWTMMKHYISNGAESYMYWNMILKPRGVSTWGDPQNAMITIDPEDKSITYNPDFYVMKHFSSMVDDGAVRLGMKGSFAGDTVGFRNPDGSHVFVMFNPFGHTHEVHLELDGDDYTFLLEAESVNTVKIYGE